MTQSEASELVSSYFDSWYSLVVRYAWRATRDLELAEDLVQEVFLRLYLEVRKGRPIEHPKAWTLTVLRREIGKHRQNSPPQVQYESIEEFDGHVPVPPPAFEPSADDLTRLVHVLSRREEETVMLRVAGLKYKDIARELGMSINSVSTLLTRALKKLKKAASEDRRGETFGAAGFANDVETLQ